MFIDLQGEISLYFADWHTHYYLDKTDYAEFCETLTAILKNEICVGTVYLGSELKWHGSRLVLPTDIDNKPPFELFAMGIPTKKFKRVLEKNGANVRFLFWNPDDDKIIAIEKR